MPLCTVFMALAAKVEFLGVKLKATLSLPRLKVRFLRWRCNFRWRCSFCTAGVRATRCTISNFLKEKWTASEESCTNRKVQRSTRQVGTTYSTSPHTRPTYSWCNFYDKKIFVCAGSEKVNYSLILVYRGKCPLTEGTLTESQCRQSTESKVFFRNQSVPAFLKKSCSHFFLFYPWTTLAFCKLRAAAP